MNTTNKVTIGSRFNELFLTPHREMIAKEKELRKTVLAAIAALKAGRSERRATDAKNMAAFKAEQKKLKDARLLAKKPAVKAASPEAKTVAKVATSAQDTVAVKA